MKLNIAENQDIEFKESWRDEYLKWICGFANTFYKAGFVESWGRGIKKICNKFSAAGLPEPVFENFCGGVNVTIPRNNPEVKEFSTEYIKAFGKGSQKIGRDLGNEGLNEGLNLSDKEKIVYELIAKTDGITSKVLEEKTNFSHATIERAVKKLSEELKLIKREGSKKTGVWVKIKEASKNCNF